MSTFMHVESRRLYSWWWDSHISPKNSKWLQENLTDMDLKVNAMIKLIEEDADSFARRAEMYYKKRPELMKFVEDFYRAYRALAERYDHATGALRHAHRTIAEAFPNHIPLALPDESPSISPGAEIGPCTPEMPSPLSSLFDPDDLPKDALGGPGCFQTGNRNATFAEENESFSSRKGLKQLNEMFAPREVMTRVKLHEGKVRKGLKFQEEEDGVSQSQFYELKILSEQEVKEKENARNEIKGLQEEVSQLSIENQKLKTQIESESMNLVSSTSEVQNLRDEITKLQSEKEAAILRDQLSCESIASMETKIFDADYEFGKLHEEIMLGVIMLYSAQDQCVSLEKKNQSLILELEQSNDLLEELGRQLMENQDLLEQAVEEKDNAKNEIKCSYEQLSLVSKENQSLKAQILSETKHLQLSRAEVQSMRDAISKLESDKEAAILMNQLSQESISSLEAENFQAKDEIGKLHSENLMGVIKLCTAEEQYFALAEAYHSLKSELEDRKSVLEEIQKLSVESQNLLEQEVKEKENIKNEIECLQAKVSLLSIENQNMKSQIVSKSKHLDAYKTEVQNLRNAVSILECEREDTVFKNQFCLESINGLESELFSAKDEVRKLHEEVLMGIVKLGSAEEQHFALDNANQNLKVEIEEKEKLLEDLRISLQESEKQRVEDIEHCKIDLEEEKHQLEDVNYSLKEHILACDSNLKLLQDEIVSLKEINRKLEDEISFHLEDRKLCQQDINGLESEFLNAKDEIRKLHEEVLMGIVKLGSAEEQHFALGNANQNLKVEIEEKEKLLEDLRIFLRESEKQRVEDIEHCKMDLEEEKHQLEDVNYSLKEHILACDSNLKLLQDEIVSLKEINRKLEDEISFHLEDCKLRQQEHDSVKADRDDLDLKHKGLIEQMEVASLNMESLEILIKELQFGCTELKEGCSKLEDEKLLLCNKLQDMGRISERNTVLESTLADAMEKITVLEDSCESLITKDSIHAVEEAALFSQIKVISENMENLLEKNTLLENSLVDANSELEVLRSELKQFEKSNRFLSEQNSDLLLRKDSLISQVDIIQYSLANLEKKSAMLESNHLNLEKERDVSVAQITVLEDALKTEKNEHESLIQSNKIRFFSLENQIHLLQEDKRFKEKELDVVHQELMSFIIVIFILQKCLCDMKDSFKTEKQKHESLILSGEIQLGAIENQINLMQEKAKVRVKEFEEQQQKYMNTMSDMKEKNFMLLHECKKHSEASRCAGEIISQIEGSKLLLQKENAILGDQNGRLMNGIDLLLKSLGINKKLMNSDGSNDVQTILEEINNLLVRISNANDENQLLCAELSVSHIFLKQNALEKDLLGKELGRRNGQLLAFQRDKDQLFERCEKFGQVVNEKEQMNSSLKTELVSLCRLLSDLSEDFSNFRGEKSALEEENNVLLEEALALEHLYLFFSSSNAENLQYLKLSNDTIGSLLAVKNVHERQIRESEEKLKVAEDENKRLKEESLILMEELRSRTTMSEFDLFTARHFCEELILQVETGENLLTMKSMELLKAYQKIQCAQVEVTELRTKLNDVTDEVYEAKMMRSQVEEKIAVLLEGHACKDAEIIATHEENRMLSKELNKMSGEFELLRKGKQYLSSELQKKISELDRCEGEITNLLINIHVSAVNGAVLEDKVFELDIAYEGSEICALVQQVAIVEGITQRNEHIFKLQKMLDDFEKENSELKTNWNSCLLLFISFENGIVDVENLAHQLANLHEDQYFPSTDPQEKNNETREGDHSTTIAGALEMQKLVYKLKEIEKLMLHTYNQLKQERLLYASNLESARREIEELKLVTSDKQVKQGNKNSAGKDGQLMKDIELDRVSNSNTLNRIESAESEDQMLKLWETAERDYSNSVSNSHGIERVQESKGDQHSSEIIAEKEVSVDRQEISKEMKQSQEDWNRRVIERLSMGAEKLSVLKITAQNLRTNVESPGKKDRRRYSEHNVMQTKLKQTEEGILSLVDAHGKLMKKLEEHSKLTNGEKMGWLNRRQVWEQVLMIMDEIEKLELEVQEIHHFLVKFDEEAVESNKTQEGDRTPKVLLRDYIKGWRVGQGRKRSRICGCIRPKTQE